MSNQPYLINQPYARPFGNEQEDWLLEPGVFECTVLAVVAQQLNGQAPIVPQYVVGLSFFVNGQTCFYPPREVKCRVLLVAENQESAQGGGYSIPQLEHQRARLIKRLRAARLAVFN
jgi:hypothetical protein